MIDFRRLIVLPKEEDEEVTFSEIFLYPFQIKKDYLFLNYDTVLGGFGFLFSGVMVVSFLLFILLLLRKGNTQKIFVIIPF